MTTPTERPAILDLPHVHPANDPTLTANQRAAGRILAGQTTGRRLRTLDVIDADNRGATTPARPTLPRQTGPTPCPMCWVRPGIEHELTCDEISPELAREYIASVANGASR